MIYTGSPVQHFLGLAKIAKGQLDANYRCICLNSPPMLTEMRDYCALAGIDVEKETSRGALIFSSERGHMLGDNFEIEQMLDSIAEAVQQALADGHAGLWATGDMSWEFGHEKNFAKLLQYEYALERIFEQQPALSGICQYNAETLPRDCVQWGLCTHQSVHINETLTFQNPYYRPAGLLTYAGPIAPAVELTEMFARPDQNVETVAAH